MTLEQILQAPAFNLPNLISLSGKLSPGELKKVLLEYNSQIQSSTDLFAGIFGPFASSGIPGSSGNETEFKNDINLITNGILEVIDLYLDGSPKAAYLKLDETIQLGDIRYLLTNRTKIVPRNNSFYRLRTDKLIDPVHPLQVFHVPFELRFRIDTKRFSIPGFPCLYVSDSLHIACKELDVDDSKKHLHDAKIVRLTNNTKLKYFDIAARDIASLLSGKTTFKRAIDDKLIFEIFDYALLYPLVAACHSKIDYDTDWAAFKIEYVVPQLLLQWFRDNNRFTHGIRYFSNRVNYTYGSMKSAVHNYVFPIKVSNDNGYCNHLRNLFNSTDILFGDSFPHTSTALDDRIEEMQTSLNTMRSNKL